MEAVHTFEPEPTEYPKLLSRPAFMRSSGVVSYSSESISLPQVIDKLGLKSFEETIASLTTQAQELQKEKPLSNLTKVRLARTGTIIKLFKIFGTDNTVIEKKALDFILTDPEMVEEARQQIEHTKEAISKEEAADMDKKFIINNAGGWLERQVEKGIIPKEEAVALAAVFQKNNLTTVNQIVIYNLYRQNGSLDKNPVVEQVQLELKAIKGLLEVANIRNSSDVPVSSLLGITTKLFEQVALHKLPGGDQILLKEIIEKEIIPNTINSPKEILAIVANHPELTTVSFDLYDTLIQWTSDQIERRHQFDRLAIHFLNTNGISLTKEQFRLASSIAWNKRWIDYQQHGNEVDIRTTLGWMIDALRPQLTNEQQQRVKTLREIYIPELEKLWYKVELDTATQMPQVRQVLERLKKRGTRVILTSNASWSLEHINRVLNRLGAKCFFDAISISSEHGGMKHPSRTDFFHYSWSKVGARPSQVLHVGDNVSADQIGARNAGAQAVLYRNSYAFADIQTSEKYRTDRISYSAKALEYYKRANNDAIKSRIKHYLNIRNIPTAERQRTEAMAKEIYQKTRDVIGPAYVAQADILLTKLSNHEYDTVICMGRDSLPLAIAQKMLLNLEPDRYPGAHTDKIRYVYIRRDFIKKAKEDSSFREQYLAYLKQKGITDNGKIAVTDLLCGSGYTHQGLQEILPHALIEGYYIDSHIPSTTNHSLLKEALGKQGVSLNTSNMLLLFESLFSGSHESPLDIHTETIGIKEKTARLSPKMIRKKLRENVLTRGLSEQSLLLLNQIAIEGIKDAVRMQHRKRLLGYKDKPLKQVMETFYYFIERRSQNDIWSDIRRSIPWDNLLAHQNPIDHAFQQERM